MAEEKKQQEATTDVEESSTEGQVAEGATADAPATETDSEKKDVPSRPSADQNRTDERPKRRNVRRARRGGRREERSRPEFDQKIISIRRVTRVMAGGRRFSFSVAMVIGDKKGKVGVGIGKAGDTQLAIEKAVRNAKKNMITVPMNSDQHIPHDVNTKYASSEVMIMPAPGRGLVAGSSVRTVLELAGVKDVTAKIFSRSKNKLNNARAAITALSLLK